MKAGVAGSEVRAATIPRLRTERMAGVSRRMGLRAGCGLLCVGIVGGCGTLSNEVECTPKANQVLESADGGVTPTPKEVHTVETWAARAEEVGAETSDPGWARRVETGVRGREEEYFMAILARAARATRDLSEAMRYAGRLLVRERGARGAEIAVRELWARECCLRRSVLTGGLRGTTEGLRELRLSGLTEGATSLSLDELARHTDPDVAEAARECRERFAGGPTP